MFQERYQAGDSLLHRLDSRVKVITTLILITEIVLTPERAWPAYPLLWTLVSTLAVIGRLGAWRVARLGGVALPFTLAAAALLFTLPGKPLITILGVSISDAGASRFLSIVLKSWLAVQVTLILSMTTPFTDLLWGFGSLRIPAVLVAIVSFMYRYLFTLNDEAQRLLRARAARSGATAAQKSGGSLFWRAQVAGGMVGSLFLRSYERSERVYAAMLARGYTGQMRMMSPPPLTWRSVAQGAIPVLVLALIEALAVLWWKA